MAYRANVIKVMVASPSDVAQERRLIPQVIAEWNAIHAEDRKTVLMPIGWETHSSPETGDRPQALINKQILRDCDLLVAVFWTRFGSPTGVAPSGTVEEINEHLAAGKPAMIYFSSMPVVLESVDREQYSKVLAFKAELRGRALIGEYQALGQFHEMFVRQLAQTVIRRFTQEVQVDGEEEPIFLPRPTVSLSDSARELLLEAAQDRQGAVMRVETMGGSHVQTNDRQFITTNDPRTATQWRGAVDELEKLGFLQDRAGRGEVFFVTDAGYHAADLVKAQ